MPEQVRIEARHDPEWEYVAGAPALRIHAQQPQTGRIHERRRAAPLPPRIEAPWLLGHYQQHGIKLDEYGQPLNYGKYPMLNHHHPVDGRVLPTDMDQMPSDEGPDTWRENKVFFKEGHMGRAYRHDAAVTPVGSPARGAEAAEIDAALEAEDARMESRFASRYHGGMDLGCGAPPRVYGDPWSRGTASWDAMREERSHGTGEDTSWQNRKENETLEVPARTGKEKVSDAFSTLINAISDAD